MNISVVGAGRVGTAMAVLLGRAGHRIVAVSGRGPTRDRASRFLSDVPFLDPADAARVGELVLIGVPDDAIPGIVEQIAAAEGFRAEQWVAHLSGASGLGVLAPARAAGARLLAIHPLQTFPDVSAALDLIPGCAMAVTADDAEGFTVGERIADDLMARPFRLDDAKRPLYHAAAVFASNYLIVTGAIAEDLFRSAGVPDPLAAMLTLQRASLDNVRTPGRRSRAHRSGRARRRRDDRAQPGGAPRVGPGRGRVVRRALSRGAGTGVERRSTAGRAPRRGRRGARAMELIRAAADLTAAVDERRSAGADIGLVPTMGALHDGHASLIRRARSERDIVVVSIFVNPRQFGPDEDLSRYPRDEARDVGLAGSLGADVVWVPDVDAFYPPGTELVTPDPGPVGEVLEGAARPGHFAGVLTAVHRLFDVVGASAAYFGEKDAQQLFLVRRMVHELGLPNTIVACPTVREPDGLALSSRNAYLSPEEREQAGCLFLALSEAAELAKDGEQDPAVIAATMAREVGATPLASLDYAAVVDEATFEPPDRVVAPARALIAARFPSARLIDNLQLPAAG